MQNLPFEEKILNYLRASYPLLSIRTHEESRLVRSILGAMSKTKLPVTIYSWDSNRLLDKHTPNNTGGGSWEKVTVGDYTPKNLIENISKLGGGAGRNLFIIKDFHPYIDAPGVIRQIRNALDLLKGKGNMIVFVSPVYKIPVELEKEVQILDFNMPDDKQLEGILTSVVNTFNKKCQAKSEPEVVLTPDIKQAAIEAAKGLTFNEAQDAYSLSAIENHDFNKEFLLSVFDEKVKQVKRNGLLQYIKPDIHFDNIGGLDGLKKWIRARAKAYSQSARDYKLPYPKGVLLCGIPGCGKTALAKATANEFGFPLFQLDIGALFGKYIGESEENFRKVIETVDSIGRCILFIDEIEKSLNRNATSGAGDTGTSSRAFATLLSWLSEHKSPVFVIGTSNDHTRLPTEFIRKGRFDEMFWLDLPTVSERERIWDVLLKRYGRDSAKYNLKKLSEKSEGFTGAEIEEIIKGAMFTRFDKDGKDITNTDLEDEMNSTKPLSQTSKEEIQIMRDKAVNRLRVASSSGMSKMFTGNGETMNRAENSDSIRELDIS
jgi:SpoVK/Ycf46/Vps4 family AAA+-type ATPase